MRQFSISYQDVKEDTGLVLPVKIDDRIKSILPDASPSDEDKRTNAYARFKIAIIGKGVSDLEPTDSEAFLVRTYP